MSQPQRHTPVALLLFLAFLVPCPLFALTEVYNPDASASAYFGDAAAIYGDWAVVGARRDDDNGNSAGAAHVYHWNGTAWSHHTELDPSVTDPWAQYGFSVAIDNDVIIVGAYKEDGGGAAYVFRYASNAWTEEARLTAADADANDEFGCNVDVSGDYAIVGARKDDANGTNAGAAYIFHHADGSWIQVKKLVASDGVAGDNYGASVAIAGDLAGVGANYKNANAGQAYIYDQSLSWETEHILPVSPAANDRLGIAMAIDDGTVIVAANNTTVNSVSKAGAVYVFTNSGNWTLDATLQPENPQTDGHYGRSVAIWENRIMVGSHHHDGTGMTDSGLADTYFFDGTNWTREQTFEGTDGDLFGHAVGIYEDRIVIGAPRDDDDATDAGSAHLGTANFPSILYVSNANGDDSYNGLTAAWDGTNGPKKTISSALTAADSGDRILIEAGTYKGSSNKNLDPAGKNLTVRGISGAAATIIDCEDLGRGFYFGTAETCLLEGLTIANGAPNASGGCIRIDGAVDLTIQNCVFDSGLTRNDRYGGAIYADGATLVIEDSTFKNGEARAGGALWLDDCDNATILRCTFTNNGADLYTDGSGGAISIRYSDDVVIEDCTMTGNSAINHGGAISFHQCYTSEVRGCVIKGNDAQKGGGISDKNASGNPTIENCLIAENDSTEHGGGLYFKEATITNCTIADNTAAATYAGAIYEGSGTVTVKNSIIWGNDSPYISGTPTITYSNVEGGYTGTGNINSAPLFVDAANDDYHIQSTSPCKDAGDSTNAPTVDFDDEPRPYPLTTGSWDMGYDEYVEYATLDVTDAEFAGSGAIAQQTLIKGTAVDLSVLSPVLPNHPMERFTCTGWTATGTAPSSGTATTIPTFNIDANTVVTWTWDTEYELKHCVNGLGSITGDAEGWYDAGTVCSLTYTAEPSGSLFVRWAGHATSLSPSAVSASISFTMDSPRKMEAIAYPESAARSGANTRFKFTLYPGWTLISVPVVPTDASFDNAFDGLLLSGHRYDTARAIYIQTDTIEPMVGYYVYSNEQNEVDITVEGDPATNGGFIDLPHGWSAIGPGLNIPKPTKPSLINIYYFDVNTKTYVLETESMKAGIGYFVLTTDAISQLYVGDPALDSDGDSITDSMEQVIFGTDEHNTDTDGDRVPDGEEVANNLSPVDNTDSDADGLADDWEVYHLSGTSADWDDDPDSDGLVNLVEFIIGSDPNVVEADVDNDGLADSWELHYFNSLVLWAGNDDVDGDGVSNSDEISAQTDPTNIDTDGDGRSDLIEIAEDTGNAYFALTSDRDGDGLPDGWESEYGYDPNLADSDSNGTTDDDEDADADGLDSLEEYQNGTSPNLVDTDGDGFHDEWEVSVITSGIADPVVANTLQQAIDSLSAGGTVPLLPGVYEGAVSISSTDAITLASHLPVDPDHLQPAIISNSAGTALSLSSGSNVTVQGLTFANSVATTAGGAINANGATLTVDTCQFRNNSALSGAAINATNASTVTIDDSRFAFNSSTNAGSAIVADSSTLTMTNSIVRRNSAPGAAIVITNPTSTTLNHCTLINYAATSGTDAFSLSSGNATINNSIFWESGTPGTILSADSSSTLTMNDCVLAGGTGSVSVDGSSSLVSSNILTGDPKLTPDGHIYSTTSSAVGAAAGTEATDSDAENRDVNPDIGADEWLDTDGDTLPDFWELVYGLDPALTDTDSDSTSDDDEDHDNDSLLNDQEFQQGASPLIVDTDGDGMPDDADTDHETGTNALTWTPGAWSASSSAATTVSRASDNELTVAVNNVGAHRLENADVTINSDVTADYFSTDGALAFRHYGSLSPGTLSLSMLSDDGSYHWLNHEAYDFTFGSGETETSLLFELDYSNWLALNPYAVEADFDAAAVDLESLTLELGFVGESGVTTVDNVRFIDNASAAELMSGARSSSSAGPRASEWDTDFPKYKSQNVAASAFNSSNVAVITMTTDGPGQGNQDGLYPVPTAETTSPGNVAVVYTIFVTLNTTTDYTLSGATFSGSVDDEYSVTITDDGFHTGTAIIEFEVRDTCTTCADGVESSGTITGNAAGIIGNGTMTLTRIAKSDTPAVVAQVTTRVTEGTDNNAVVTLTYNGPTSGIPPTETRGVRIVTSSTDVAPHGTPGPAATSPDDYTHTSILVEWSQNDSNTKVRYIPITDDNVIEPNEYIDLQLLPDEGTNFVGSYERPIEIIDDDSEWRYRCDVLAVAEGDEFPIVVSRTRGDVPGNFPAATVQLNVLGLPFQTANCGQDFKTDSMPAIPPAPDMPQVYDCNGSPHIETLYFNEGETEQTLYVTTLTDSLVEGTETVAFSIRSASAGSIEQSEECIVSITDETAPPTLSIAAASVTEGDAGTVDMVFTATIDTAAETSLSFDYFTEVVVGQTATADVDFWHVALGDRAPVTFPAGTTQRTFVIRVIGDINYEANETFTLKTSNTDDFANTTAPEAIGTIIENDSQPTLRVHDVTVEEDSGSAVLTVSMDKASYQGVSFDYSTTDGTATSGSDYTAVSDETVDIPVGATSVTITTAILDDATSEGTETYSVNISNVSNATIADGTGVVTILDDERPSISFTKPVYRANVNDATVVLTMRASEAVAQNTTVSYSATDITAVLSTDYTAGTPSSPATILASETDVTVSFSLIATNLAIGEKREFEVTLTATSSNATLGDQLTARVIIYGNQQPDDLLGPEDSMAAGDPVNVVTGAFTTSGQFVVPGQLPIVGRWTYNSSSDDLGLLGYGWRFGYTSTLALSGDEQSIRIVKTDGGTVNFERQTGTDTFLPAVADNPNANTVGPGNIAANPFLARVEYDSVADSYTYSTGDGMSCVYSEGESDAISSYALLTKISDPTGNALTFQYNNVTWANSALAADHADPSGDVNDAASLGRMTRIVNSSGRSLQIMYTELEDGVRPVIDKLIANDGREVDFTYDSTDLHLTAVRMTHPVRHTEGIPAPVPTTLTDDYSYEYAASSHLITKALRPDGRYIRNVWDVNDRVTEQYGLHPDPAQGSTEVQLFAYDYSTANQTTVTTYQDSGVSYNVTYKYHSDVDKKNLVYETVRPDSRLELSTWDSNRRLTSREDKIGGVTQRFTQYYYEDSTSQILKRAVLKTDITGDGLDDLRVTRYHYFTVAERPTLNALYLPKSMEIQGVAGTVGTPVTIADVDHPILRIHDYDYLDNGRITMEEVREADDTLVRGQKWTYYDTTELVHIGIDETVYGLVRDTVTYGAAGPTGSDRYERSQIPDAIGNNVQTLVGADGNGHYRYQQEYYIDGKVATIESPTGERASFAYNEYGQTYAIKNPRGFLTQTTFDDARNVEKVTGPRGEEISMTYSRADDIMTITTDAGLQESHEYDYEGNRVATTIARNDGTDAMNVLTETTYDAHQRPTQVEFDAPNGESRTFLSLTTTNSFTDSSRQTSVTGRYGEVTQLNATPLGQQKTISRPETSSDTTFEYDLLGRTTKATDPTGDYVEFTYDAASRVLTEETFDYDSGTQTATQILYRAYEYDALNNVTAIHWDDGDPAERTTTFRYDERGLLIEQIGPAPKDGSTQLRLAFDYDASGRTVNRWQWRDNDEADEAERALTHYRYTHGGLLESITLPDGTTYFYEYDDSDNRTAILRSLKHLELSEIDGYDLSDTHRTEYHYDLNDRLEKVLTEDPDGSTGSSVGADDTTRNYQRLEYTYYTSGDLKSVLDPKDRLWEVIYDALGRVSKRQVTFGSPSQTIVYQELTYSASTVQGAALKVERKDYPNSHNQVTTYHYDGRGNLVRTVDPSGQNYDQDYFDDDLIQQASYPGSRVEDFTYGVDNVVDYDNTTEFTYKYNQYREQIAIEQDASDHLSFVRNGAGATIGESYHGTTEHRLGYHGFQNGISKWTYERDGDYGALSFSTNNMGETVYVGLQASTNADWQFPYVAERFNTLQQAEIIALGRTNTAASYQWQSYDSNGKLKERWYYKDSDWGSTSGAGGWENTFKAITGDYDLAGNLKTYDSDVLDTDKDFSYDGPFDMLVDDGVATYEYDNYDQLGTDVPTMGNRTKRTETGQPTETYVYNKSGNSTLDSLNRLYEIEHNGSQAITYDYDAEGNRIKRHSGTGLPAWTTPLPDVEYIWNERNQLAEVQYRTDYKWTFEYDALGRRIHRAKYGWVSGAWSSTPSEERYVLYAGEYPVAEFDGAGDMVQQTAWLPTSPGGVGGLLLLRVKDAGTWKEYRPVYDNRSNVIAMIDESDDVAERYEYDAFGRTTIYDQNDVVISSTAIGNPYQFSTKHHDHEIELYHFGFRYYDTKPGSFISPDPLWYVDGPNRYVYVRNNPIRYIDPYGLQGGPGQHLGRGTKRRGPEGSAGATGAAGAAVVGLVESIMQPAFMGVDGVLLVTGNELQASELGRAIQAIRDSGMSKKQVAGMLAANMLKGASPIVGASSAVLDIRKKYKEAIASGDYNGAAKITGEVLSYFAGTGLLAKLTKPKAPKGELNASKPSKPDDSIDTPQTKQKDVDQRTKNTAEQEGGCFLAGTLVKTEYGDKAIQELEFGDKVWAYDTQSGDWGLCTVIETFVRSYDGDIVTLEVAEETIEATGNHPFWVVGGVNLAARPFAAEVGKSEREGTPQGRWVEARDLKVGDLLLLANGTIRAIKSTTHDQRQVAVYNVHVETLHTYAVSGSGILVHNSSSDDGPDAPKSEIVYRAMSVSEYNKLVKSGGLSTRGKGSSELFVTAVEDYVTKGISNRPKLRNQYKVKVAFELEPGTTAKLTELGHVHPGAALHWPGKPLFRAKDNAVQLKLEKDGVPSYGLGYSEEALELFNRSIRSWTQLQ